MARRSGGCACSTMTQIATSSTTCTLIALFGGGTSSCPLKRPTRAKGLGNDASWAVAEAVVEEVEARGGLQGLLSLP